MHCIKEFASRKQRGWTKKAGAIHENSEERHQRHEIHYASRRVFFFRGRQRIKAKGRAPVDFFFAVLKVGRDFPGKALRDFVSFALLFVSLGGSS